MDLGFLKSTKVVVRLYIFNIKDIISVNDDGTCNPYIKIKIGDFEINVKL